ncbi:hypothetical protein [Desulfonatronum thioautotrophicum]|uniref:hypothetical protein n=1 Tax=Desulfonatronum thioautotrophicum TaxID=617001 RepID=UPI0005EB3F23|nr:hypothetical protein [Desulfonatronum thioautotrophicum]
MDTNTKVESATSEEVTENVSPNQEQPEEKKLTEADHLYTLLKPLHNLPRGKNTWDPKFIKVWWFWPASAAFLLVLFHVYPYIWDFFASR